MNSNVLLVAIALFGIVSCLAGESARGDYVVVKNFDQPGSP